MADMISAAAKAAVGAVGLAIVVGMAVKGGDDATASAGPSRGTAVEQAAPEPVAAPPEPSPLELVVEAGAFQDALAAALPMMSDTVDDESAGAIALALWASTKMVLGDVWVEKNETSLKLVKKDSDSARGKRMCIKGRIVQIAKQDTGTGKPAFKGLMSIGYSDYVSFLAVNSTGELVDGSRGKLCGVVTGRYAFSNVSGGQTQTVQVVGVFDIPENR